VRVADHMAARREFRDQYVARTHRSREVFEEAQRHLAGGVPGSASYRRPHPLYIREAVGSTITDVDGNEYVDLFIGGGPNILGHSPPVIRAAVEAQLAHGTSTIAPPETAVELAKKIQKHMPHMELLRFVQTGSEAVHIAMRIARAYTGREKIATFEGTFHGQIDNELVSGKRFAGPEDGPEPVLDSAGVPRSVLGDTVVLPFNNTDATVALLERHGPQLAAVLIEPVGGVWMPGVAAENDFLKEVRAVAAKHDALLIFDEVLTGFRVGLGGWAAESDVVPDLTALAKPIGGGFPLAAVGGRRDIMDQAVSPGEHDDDETKIFQSGTFQSNLVSLVAGLAAITELEKPGVYEHLDALSDRLCAGLLELSAAVDMDVVVARYGSMFGLYFGIDRVANVRDVARSDRELAATFTLGLVANGVYLPPIQPRGFANAALTVDDIDRVLDVAERVFLRMRQAGEPVRAGAASA
jgi:glutamate-1-semialdehyde 2,1-aminomutase